MQSNCKDGGEKRNIRRKDAKERYPIVYRYIIEQFIIISSFFHLYFLVNLFLILINVSSSSESDNTLVDFDFNRFFS